MSQNICCPRYQNCRGILVLITYCSNSRIHLIGLKIVQSVSSHGSVEASRKNWSNIWVCVCVWFSWEFACEWENERERRALLCYPVTLAAAGKSVQYQWQLTANIRNVRKLSARATSGRKHFIPPLLLLFCPPIIYSKCGGFFLLKGKANPHIKLPLNLVC